MEFDLESGIYTEVQPGSYAFMDRDYGDREYLGALRYEQANDEHGIVTPRSALPGLGTVLQLVPGQCDPTFNLHDTVVGFRGATIDCLWPIAARGLSR